MDNVSIMNVIGQSDEKAIEPVLQLPDFINDQIENYKSTNCIQDDIPDMSTSMSSVTSLLNEGLESLNLDEENDELEDMTRLVDNINNDSVNPLDEDSDNPIGLSIPIEPEEEDELPVEPEDDELPVDIEQIKNLAFSVQPSVEEVSEEVEDSPLTEDVEDVEDLPLVESLPEEVEDSPEEVESLPLTEDLPLDEPLTEDIEDVEDLPLAEDLPLDEPLIEEDEDTSDLVLEDTDEDILSEEEFNKKVDTTMTSKDTTQEDLDKLSSITIAPSEKEKNIHLIDMSDIDSKSLKEEQEDV